MKTAIPMRNSTLAGHKKVPHIEEMLLEKKNIEPNSKSLVVRATTGNLKDLSAVIISEI